MNDKMFASLAELHAALEECMIVDRRRLLRAWHRLQGNTAGTRSAALARQFAPAVAVARARAATRVSRLPVPQFANALPISARREEIGAAIAEHQVVVVCGATGSGKSTQLPKICLSLGLGARGLIGHTQPRRLAARTLAARIAFELGGTVGAAVGYKVRFSEELGRDTCIKLMTDGVLLAETQSDRWLEAYETLIIDEAHERSLNIDLLLGYLKTLLPKRRDLKVIITSATIDPWRFSSHFNDAPVIEVSGRRWPVEVRYRPLEQDAEARESDMNTGIVAAAHELSHLGRGDILVFLPGEREIREAAEVLCTEGLPDTDILPLYARLTQAEQQRIFDPHRRRHIVLATNVAETSLTVPGVRYVIDTGLARVSRYSPRTKVQRLPIEPVSQASADQRAGRCGRTAAGVCIRLYSEEDYQSRLRYTEPEIRRTSLAAVILQLEALGCGDVQAFPFLDPPETRDINAAYTLLHELGAVDAERRLTPPGRTLARLPADPRIARLLVAANAEHCLAEMLVIAAALSVQDPRESPYDRRLAAAAAQAVFKDERSDFLWHLNFYRQYESRAGKLSRRQLAAFCREHFVSPARVREWRDTHLQFAELVKELGYRHNAQPANYAAIHRALLTGFLSHVGFRVDAQTYQGARNTRPAIFPGSALHKRQPKWFVAAQIVETSRLYARTVAAIEPEWIERAGAHLLKRSVSEPHWDRRAGRVTAFENITLLGLTVAAGRRIDFGRINPGEARDIFIREALVAGGIDTQPGFLDRNLALLEQLKVFEHKARRLDLIADEQAIFDFYDERLPENICAKRALEQWLRESGPQGQELLSIARETLLRAEPAAAEMFPDHAVAGSLRLPLSYRFEPGHDEDGVTATVPLLALTQLDPARFEWLVPGMLKEKIGVLIRLLPKAQRRRLSPVSRYAAACAVRLEWGAGDLCAALARCLSELSGSACAPSDFRLADLPEHLRMHFHVIDAHGNAVGADRDLQKLQLHFGGSVRESFAGVPAWTGRTDKVTRWDFGDLPQAVIIRRAGTEVAGHPALEDAGDGVLLRVVDTPEHARVLNRAGVRRLFMLELSAQLKYLRANLPRFARMSLLFSPMGDAATLREDIILTVFDRVFMSGDPPIATRPEFDRRREQGRGQLVAVANALCAAVADVLERAHALRAALQGARPAWHEAATEIEGQLEALVYPGFIAATPPAVLPHLARYLNAASLRVEKLARDPARDRQRQRQFAPCWQRYLEWRRRGEKDVAPAQTAAAFQDYRWLLEEYRVSLFAQELGTAAPVSAARLDRQWSRVLARE